MILVIDNYDSFTYNLVQYVGELGEHVEVRRNDAITVAGVHAATPTAVIISPGPCTPSDAGVSVDVVRELGAVIPMLGVCLGHQAIAEAYGGRVVRASRVMHGKMSAIVHDGSGIFAALPSPLRVMRYHSLIVERATLPDALQITATTDEVPDEIQAMRHREFPVWGVQFHPESVLTEHGKAMIANFLAMAHSAPR